MPIYHYQCSACKDSFEIHQFMKDSPLTSCNFCGEYIERRYEDFGVVLKGPGFYKTDNEANN